MASSSNQQQQRYYGGARGGMRGGGRGGMRFNNGFNMANGGRSQMYNEHYERPGKFNSPNEGYYSYGTEQHRGNFDGKILILLDCNLGYNVLLSFKYLGSMKYRVTTIRIGLDVRCFLSSSGQSQQRRA